MLPYFGYYYVTYCLVDVYVNDMWGLVLERVVAEDKKKLVTSCVLTHYTEYSILKGLEKCETPEKSN